MKKFASFLFAVLMLVALAAPSYACNPATAAAFAQAAGFNSYGFGAPAFVSTGSCGCGTAAVAVPARVNYGFNRAFVSHRVAVRTVAVAPVAVVGANTIVQNGRRNVIRSGAGVGASLGGGTTIIQNGRRNRIR